MPEFGTMLLPEGFVTSEDVAAVANDLIRNEVGFTDLAGVKLAYLLNHGTTPSDARGVHAMAKAVKAPPLWLHLSGYDGAVWVLAKAWEHLSARQREAVIYHELSHFMVDEETGSLRLLKHDLEEFGRVVAKYGAWYPDVEHFAEQLRLGQAGPTAR